MKNIQVNEQGFAPLILIAAIAGTLVVGTGTVIASNTSKPGDVLYSIDRGAETAQFALALTDGRKKELHATFATERLTELEALYAEEELDSEGVADAQDNYEEHHDKLVDLFEADGTLDDHESKLEQDLEQKKTEVDKAAETEQKSLESEREGLKKQYEQALKDGDTAKATALKVQIGGYEQKLKTVETERELHKQETEKQQELDKKELEQQKEADEQKTQEAEQEDDHKDESELR